jgi:hypothetical protein
MAKTKVSATELIWIFQERLRSSVDCASGTYVAIVPSKDGWAAVMNARRRNEYPLCAKRIEKPQKELRDVYVLTKD